MAKKRSFWDVTDPGWGLHDIASFFSPHQAGQQLSDIGMGGSDWAKAWHEMTTNPHYLLGMINQQISGKKGAAKPAAPAAQQQQQQQQTPQQQTIFDPLNMQTLFSSVIAPYLNQAAQSYSDQIGQYGSAMNAALAKPMDPTARAMFQASVPQAQASMLNENQALQGLSIAQPEFQSLLSNLNLARQAAYTQAKAIANYNALNATGLAGLSPSQLNSPNTKLSPLQQAQLNTLGITG